jgi:hypothetical protein
MDSPVKINLTRTGDGGLLPFNTPKYKYIPLAPGSPIGVQRWTEYEKLKIVFGFGRTFEQMYDALKNIQNLLASDNPFHEIRQEAIISIHELIKGIASEGRARYNHAFYLCSIFIIRAGDEGKPWTFEMATDYIEDWEQSALNEQDMFFFALSVTSGLSHVLKKERQEVADRLERLSGLHS